jgi:hypothetical protein
MKPDKRTIEQVGGFVTVHAALPPKLLKWAAKRADEQGHKDLSLVVRDGIDCLIERHKADSASA